MGRIAGVATLALLAACSFDPSGLHPGESDDAATGDDAAIVDDAPIADGATIDAPAIDAPPIDAPAIDARLVDAATCPTGYNGAYRYIPTATTWLAAEQDCENDQPGSTHLAVINEAGEGGIVIAVLTTTIGAGNEVWVGVVRDPNVTQWRWVTGGNAAYLPWGTAQPDLGTQLVVRTEKLTGQYFDRPVDDTLPALCECDGHPPVNADYTP